MKQRLIWQGFLASLVLALAASGSARAALAPQEQRLIPGAKKEGEVLILSATMVDSTAVKLRAAFIKRYGLGDGFRVNVLRKGTGAIVSTMRQEIQAGKITSDVPIVSAP
ncbi:MAG: hypothetical protein HYT99_05035, partial [Candidatus Tectomicrobia bacterium]|nr:hypothetical protein [Candidatus Tectomicrobia bacterium]